MTDNGYRTESLYRKCWKVNNDLAMCNLSSVTYSNLYKSCDWDQARSKVPKNMINTITSCSLTRAEKHRKSKFQLPDIAVAAAEVEATAGAAATTRLKLTTWYRSWTTTWSRTRQVSRRGAKLTRKNRMIRLRNWIKIKIIQKSSMIKNCPKVGLPNHLGRRASRICNLKTLPSSNRKHVLAIPELSHIKIVLNRKSIMKAVGLLMDLLMGRVRSRGWASSIPRSTPQR